MLTPELFHDFGNLGLADAEEGRNLAAGLALGHLLPDVHHPHIFFIVAAVLEMVFLATGGEVFEVDEVVVLLDLIDQDIVGVVAEGTVADLHLLDVADALPLGGGADGDDAVKEVEKALGAAEVVLGNGAGERAFGRVGDDEEGPSVLELQEFEVLHEGAGIGAFVHVVAEIADVVHHDNVAVVGQGRLLDVFQDDFLIVLGDHGHGVYLGTEEGVGEFVALPGDGVGVAELELLVGHLAVDVEDAVPDGDVGGHLNGEDGFSEVGVGKEAADFLFEPEFVVEWVRVWALLGVGDRVVGGLDAEDAHFAGVLGFVQGACDGFERVGSHIHFLPRCL